MKKRVLLVMILLVAFLSFCATYAYADSIDRIPQKVVDILTEKGVSRQSLENYVVVNQVEPLSGHTYLFVSASKDGTHHTVYQFANTASDEDFNQYWEYKASYDSLAPQGKGTVHFSRHEHNDRYGENGNVQLYDDSFGFTIYLTDPQNPEEFIRGVSVHVVDKKFQIVAWFDNSASPVCNAYIKNGKLYYGNNKTGKRYGSVTLYRTFDLNTSFSSLPKTYKKATEKFTAPAAIPTGEMTAELIKFTSNKKYAVYSAPDKNSYRASNGKATVSTNDWIQVFGQEGDWILIQYAINSEHYRFGYIPAKSLPKKANVKQLGFEHTSAYASQTVSITDDPLYSRTDVSTLSEGCTVTWLATMGDWAYVEYQGDAATNRLRGFVPVSSLRMLNREQAISIAQNTMLTSNPMADMQLVTQEALLGYSVTADYDANTGVWSVRFNSVGEYGYTVCVDDRTSIGWLELASNG